METTFNLKLQAAGAALAVALLSGGCAMFEPRAERYVPPPAGATWVSSRRDTGSYGTANVQLPNKFLGEQTRQGQKVIAFESPESTLLLKPEGAFISQVKGDTPLISWNPPATFQWPLEVGKSWKRSYTVTIHAAKQNIPVQDTQTVEAYEDVTMPAGTFKAFRVRTIDNAGNDNVQWFSPELGIFIKQSLKRTANHQQGPGTREIELVSQKIR